MIGREIDSEQGMNAISSKSTEGTIEVIECWSYEYHRRSTLTMDFDSSPGELVHSNFGDLQGSDLEPPEEGRVAPVNSFDYGSKSVNLSSTELSYLESDVSFEVKSGSLCDFQIMSTPRMVYPKNWSLECLSALDDVMGKYCSSNGRSCQVQFIHQFDHPSSDLEFEVPTFGSPLPQGRSAAVSSRIYESSSFMVTGEKYDIVPDLESEYMAEPDRINWCDIEPLSDVNTSKQSTKKKNSIFRSGTTKSRLMAPIGSPPIISDKNIDALKNITTLMSPFPAWKFQFSF